MPEFAQAFKCNSSSPLHYARICGRIIWIMTKNSTISTTTTTHLHLGFFFFLIFGRRVRWNPSSRNQNEKKNTKKKKKKPNVMNKNCIKNDDDKRWLFCEWLSDPISVSIPSLWRRNESETNNSNKLIVNELIELNNNDLIIIIIIRITIINDTFEWSIIWFNIIDWLVSEKIKNSL